MTDRHVSDLTQLDQATSRSLPRGVPLDDDTVELRDSWLALGRAMDAENAGFREEDLLARLLTDAELHLEGPRPAAGRSRERFWPALLASALALTILVTVARVWFISDNDNGLAGNGSPNRHDGDPAIVAAEWSDPLDDELDAAAYRVHTLVAQAAGVDDSLLNLADHMESMSDELIHGSL